MNGKINKISAESNIKALMCKDCKNPNYTEISFQNGILNLVCHNWHAGLNFNFLPFRTDPCYFPIQI